MLNVSITPRDDDCTRPAALILQCTQCLASITLPCQNLLIHTVSATADPREGLEGLGVLGSPLLGMMLTAGGQLAAGSGSEHGAGRAVNDAWRLKKLLFPLTAGRKVSDGVWLQQAEPGPGALLAK